MVTVIINGVKVVVDKNSTVLQACESVGIEIPRFCFHERLSVAGNCRMCLVEIEKSPKPQASCALPVMDNMKIFTDTPLVKSTRGSFRILLINHPLDLLLYQGGTIFKIKLWLCVTRHVLTIINVVLKKKYWSFS